MWQITLQTCNSFKYFKYVYLQATIRPWEVQTLIHVVKQQKGDIFSIKMTGSIEESVDFMALVGMPPTQRVEILLREVTRINSLGVKAWIKYFQTLQAKALQVRLVECSTAIVEAINSIVNFTCGATVESLYVPYVCKGCKTELLGLFRAADLKKFAFKIPPLTCSKCQSEATFDDIPEEYFGFLIRK